MRCETLLHFRADSAISAIDSPLVAAYMYQDTMLFQISTLKDCELSMSNDMSNQPLRDCV